MPTVYMIFFFLLLPYSISLQANKVIIHTQPITICSLNTSIALVTTINEHAMEPINK